MSEETGYIDGKPTPTYRIWAGMKNRCLNPRNKDFGHYGARGITVCDRWASSFAAFFADMGARPEGLTIDRLLGSGNYEPGNCRWATRREQRMNVSDVRVICLDGKPVPLVDARDLLGLKRKTVKKRISLGWSIPRAFETERATAKG